MPENKSGIPLAQSDDPVYLWFSSLRRPPPSLMRTRNATLISEGVDEITIYITDVKPLCISRKLEIFCEHDRREIRELQRDVKLLFISAVRSFIILTYSIHPSYAYIASKRVKVTLIFFVCYFHNQRIQKNAFK